MKRKLLILVLALALVTLCACGASNGDGGTLMFGRNIFYTRTATDEEAFSHTSEQVDGEEIILDDGAVPLAGLPAEAEGEGWLLVRYAVGQDGTAQPLWYRVWTAENCWNRENLPYDGTGWNPVIPGRAEGVR